MPRTVAFSDKVVAKAAAVSPSFEFPEFAQAAVREKINKELRELRHAGASMDSPPLTPTPQSIPGDPPR